MPLHFRSWHRTDMAKYLGNVRYWMNSGKHMLAVICATTRLAVSNSGHPPLPDIGHHPADRMPRGSIARFEAT